MSHTPGLTDEVLSAATAAFLAYPEVFSSFLTTLSAIFIEEGSLACAPSPMFIDSA
jgi:hypothetical protein